MRELKAGRDPAEENDGEVPESMLANPAISVFRIPRWWFFLCADSDRLAPQTRADMARAGTHYNRPDASIH
jgi:hypothetical protein